ncbi:MAG: sodium:proton antiporter [Ectothiorhodospiraceae bacterium]|nr:sodium:proton antiporter [Ectothiorhodospiraceae bacterium]
MRTLRHILSFAAAFVFTSGIAIASEGAEHGESHLVPPDPLMIIPFVVLLLAIALMPFINAKFWHHYFPHISIGLGLITIVYYVFFLHNPVRMMHSGIEYVSFIALVGSLFVVAGGIHIDLKGYATPWKNAGILAFGSVLANVVGTTGSSMILIRPFMRNNKNHLKPYHVVFFIFLVSNIGGGLTPIGDPPLFLGYLKGIPFFWVLFNVWHIWLATIIVVLGVFLVVDFMNYRKLDKSLKDTENAAGDKTEFRGLHNIGFLLVILVSVFITDPPFVREALMIAAAVGSYYTTKREIHQANDFNFFPIKEVGFLFLGLFATMVPALDWLELNAGSLGVTQPGQFYWGTGILSSFLDNAPTYLNFLSAEIGLLATPELMNNIREILAGGINAEALSQQSVLVQDAVHYIAAHHPSEVADGTVTNGMIQIAILLSDYPIFVVAISVSAVFFGAMTYIGNAPNFMVKSIAEQGGAEMPSFFGYLVKYSIPILLPIFAIVWLIWFF